MFSDNKTKRTPQPSIIQSTNVHTRFFFALFSSARIIRMISHQRVRHFIHDQKSPLNFIHLPLSHTPSNHFIVRHVHSNQDFLVNCVRKIRNQYKIYTRKKSVYTKNLCVIV